ncbi:MAG: hypothetical protein Ct9H300mP9_2410 [Candidatus Neomarinimicrobiota bacterium]|nr:MAG: hypothetical protein Ct9H300mP9_2410 [Candidatus Neomarinimicrobiota bacterium]
MTKIIFIWFYILLKAGQSAGPPNTEINFSPPGQIIYPHLGLNKKWSFNVTLNHLKGINNGVTSLKNILVTIPETLYPIGKMNIYFIILNIPKPLSFVFPIGEVIY